MPVDTPPAPAAPTPAAPVAATPAPANPAPAAPATPAAVVPPAAEPAKAIESLLGGAKDDAIPKPGEPKPGEPKKDDVKQGAPEKYADFKLPEGLTLDKGLADKFAASAKKLGLSQESAQELVTLQAENAAATLKAGLDSWNQTKEGWRNETIKELGANYEKELSYAAKALDRFGGPELRQLLSDTGLGEHKLLAKAFIAIGKQMSEPVHVEGERAGVSSSREDIARSMFPSMYNADGSPKK